MVRNASNSHFGASETPRNGNVSWRGAYGIVCKPCGLFRFQEQVPHRLGSGIHVTASCIAKISGTSKKSRDVQHALRTPSTLRKLAIIRFADYSVGFRHWGVRATHVDAHRGRYCSPVARPLSPSPGQRARPIRPQASTRQPYHRGDWLRHT